MSAKTEGKIQVLGLMSGTSLDGLDMVLCSFEHTEARIQFNILEAQTINYSKDWKTKLKEVGKAKAEDYFRLHADYGRFIAEEIVKFLKNIPQKPDYIASHGHTVFHQPKLGFSTQLGCGATIAAISSIDTVCDFRSLDVALGGQGAPLVPIGDQLLFGDYEACLNIGGIANISFNNDEGNRVAYDVCEANMLLNYLSEKIGHPYDAEGEMARSGNVDQQLLKKINALPYYREEGAKSIGREWFEDQVLKTLEEEHVRITDLLATSTEHVAMIIANELTQKKLKSVLVSGGGAFNSFLMERIREHTACEIIIPNAEIINFKEALIFAFLGYLRVIDKTNTLSSVTGASRNSIGGAVYTAR
ncbi:MAG: anhydro-N-acetylmuramic acid kinase [bacterium]|nr:anhydro-N-acetylmuramic acid kinase [bacterium]